MDTKVILNTFLSHMCSLQIEIDSEHQGIDRFCSSIITQSLWVAGKFEVLSLTIDLSKSDMHPTSVQQNKDGG